MWSWSLLLTKAKATGRSWSGSVASRRVKPPGKLVDAQRPAEAVQDPTAMVRQVELPDPLVEAVVDEAVGEVQEEVSVHRPEELLDAHPIVEDAVEHGFTDLVVVQGAGFHARGSGAEGRATVATGPVFAIGDVEVDDLLVGDGTDLTMKNILALTQLTTSGAWGLARGAFQGYGSNAVCYLYCNSSSAWFCLRRGRDSASSRGP